MGAKRHSVSSPRTHEVLCVDDHVPGLKIRKIFLESFGYSVQTAETGAAALESAAKRHFDVVVLDYRMPGMNGLELARALKERFPELPVILLSGYSAEMPKELDSLVNGSVTKGSHPEVLLQRLAEVLGQPAPKPREQGVSTAALAAKTREQLEEGRRLMKKASEMRSRGGKRGSGGGRRSA